MTRALSLTCACLVLLVGSVAFADRPKIAVLGLEVQGTDITSQDTQVAKELTEALRARAKLGTVYQFAPGSEKELVDEKLLKSCDTEAVACMAQIGADLGADQLLYGKIDRQGPAYRVDLKLLNVQTKAPPKQFGNTIPVSDAQGAKLQMWAKRAYASLTGQPSSGSLVVKVSNAERATVLIDDQPKGNVVNNKAVVPLSPGKYHVTVQSEGMKPWEKDVTVGDEGDTTVNVDLEKAGDNNNNNNNVIEDNNNRIVTGTVSHTDHRSGWKAAFYTSAALTVASGVAWVVGYTKYSSIEDDICAHGYDIDGGCGGRKLGNTPVPGYDVKGQNDQGKKYATIANVGWAATAGFGVLGVIALYEGFIAHDDSTERPTATANRKVHRQRFSVTPVVSPQGGGATLRLDW